MPTNRNGSGRHFSEANDGVEDHSLRSSQKKNYQECCVDPPGDHPRSGSRAHTTHLKEAHLGDTDRGHEAETVVFIAGSDDPGGGARTCMRCRGVVCRVLTCGLYRVCQRTLLAPCLAGPPDPPEDKQRNKAEEEEEEEVEMDEYHDEPGDGLGDVYLNGVKVDIHRGDLGVVTTAPSSFPGRPPARLSSPEPRVWELPEEEEEEEEEGEGVDALINKKLLKLYTEYQIEELARCTTDSVFLSKSNDIHLLINSLAEEHQMDKQEAECRLVRGIIRISTRRSKRRAVSERTPSDSGNETMRTGSGSGNNNDYKSNPNIQISEVTDSDMNARKMRRNHSKGHSTLYTDTMSSSGISVTRTSMRT
ncbi:hypothetical protein NHX12_023730 [Muraenolepis orangiensis]|uniref:Keratinocyte differentiation factor 1 n=1 Tax=Muraenolepis orangiensis TaxID=630683 RepID=A0A9Q0IU33_9TELE|nr:hypothetical protein NHX12_023730 [Muraenolepis orangiensis]